jgi:Ca2+-binding EF-hand superfamily protein
VQQAEPASVHFGASRDHLQEHLMKLATVKTLTLASLLAVSVPPAMLVTSASPAFAASALKTLDPDKDGTVDLNEAKIAASALFDKLEKDNDGTLDRKELHGRIPDADWAVADPDNDKTISKDEYLAYVEALFKKADADNDGTLDAKELKTPAGHVLLRLLMK